MSISRSAIRRTGRAGGTPRLAPVARCALTLALCATPATAGSTWTVDDSGGGDFRQITEALASPLVLAGDTLVVRAGSYAGFTLDRELTLVAPAGEQPQVGGTTRIESRDGATISGFSLVRLEAEGVSGKLLLHEVRVHDGFGLPCVAARVTDCADVHFDRCTLIGKDGDVICESTALRVESSFVTLTGCSLKGGDGWGDTFEGYNGRNGLEIVGTGDVLLARTDVTGGDGGTPTVVFDGFGGHGVPAISVFSPGSRAIIRGDGTSPLVGGKGGFGGFPGEDAFTAVSGGGTLVVSGVPADPPAYSLALDLTEPDPPQPFVFMVGSGAPVSTQRLSTVGPPGAPLWLVGSLLPAHLPLPGVVDGPLLLDPTVAFLIVPLVTLGRDVAVNLTFVIPAVDGLEGVRAVFQGFAPGQGAGGSWLATNPADIVVR
jgi:hypothetical protein